MLTITTAARMPTMAIAIKISIRVNPFLLIFIKQKMNYIKQSNLTNNFSTFASPFFDKERGLLEKY
ncbi:MAG: hypothetical protein A3J76_03475 [Candidatus Moranbacteria bacterium RBG_13_45_13]|nr:MAG: hypothetical protein A3J76_03475 [Candidatus Moranbacteria bacterium RBG_13_45_13]